MKTNYLTLLSFCSAVCAHAGPRASTDYTITTETIDAGGGRTSSAAYTHDGSVGGIGGISTVAAPAQTARHGYIGQLYEVASLSTHATPASVDESAATQLGARLVLDDDSLLELDPATVAWSVVAGPLTGISAAGLVTAGVVWQDTVASVTGHHSGHGAMLGILVRDVDPDNFGLYAGDGLPDQWQAGHFGIDNPLAAPGEDPDGDGQDNRFEFTAGVDPTDAASRFLLRIEPVAGQPTHKRLIFSPRFTDRSYHILTSTTLATDSWSTLTGGSISDNGTERTIIDPNATGDKKFYRVGITRP
jgi:hypothetical protein